MAMVKKLNLQPLLLLGAFCTLVTLAQSCQSRAQPPPKGDQNQSQGDKEKKKEEKKASVPVVDPIAKASESEEEEEVTYAADEVDPRLPGSPITADAQEYSITAVETDLKHVDTMLGRAQIHGIYFLSTDEEDVGNAKEISSVSPSDKGASSKDDEITLSSSKISSYFKKLVRAGGTREQHLTKVATSAQNLMELLNNFNQRYAGSYKIEGDKDSVDALTQKVDLSTQRSKILIHRLKKLTDNDQALLGKLYDERTQGTETQ